MHEFLIQRCDCLGYDEYYLLVKFCILFSGMNLYKNTSFWSSEASRLKSRLRIARMILLIMHGHVTIFLLIETAAPISSSTFKCSNWQLNQKKDAAANKLNIFVQWLILSHWVLSSYTNKISSRSELCMFCRTSIRARLLLERKYVTYYQQWKLIAIRSKWASLNNANFKWYETIHGN